VVSVTDLYGRILGFLDRSSSLVALTRLSGPRSRPTTFFLVVPGIEPQRRSSIHTSSEKWKHFQYENVMPMCVRAVSKGLAVSVPTGKLISTRTVNEGSDM
jgi:hypothetical protein